jgi:hypothetical protein
MSFDPIPAGSPLWYRNSVPHLSISSHSFPCFASQYRLKYPTHFCIPAVFSPIVGVLAAPASDATKQYSNVNKIHRECFNISEISKGNERFYIKTGLLRREILSYT